MADIANTLASMFSLIIVTILGYIAAKCGFINAEIRPKLSNLIFNVTLPCTILASIGEVDSSTGGDQIMWSIILGTAFFFVMLLASAIACFVVRAPRNQTGLYLFQGILTNTGFIGFAVLESIFGGASVFLGSIYIAIANVFLYSIGIAALGIGSDRSAAGEKQDLGETLKGAVKNMINVPLVVSLIAMVIFFAGIPVPSPIMQAASMTGGITAPLAMMLVGLSIADADLGRVLTNARLWGFAIVRFLLVPLACYFLLSPIITDKLVMGVFIVMLAMPTGSMAGPIAATYGYDGDLPARGTIVATIASFVIVPILMTVMTTF